MEKIKLGKTDLIVNRLGLGCGGQRWYEIKKLMKGRLPDVIPTAMHAFLH